MPGTRLILVDGMPGTGKSTLAQFVHQQLTANEYPAVWCHEESANHPVRLFHDPRRHHSWSDYCEQVAARWRYYARELRARSQTVVLDAALFQNHVRSMLMFDCDRDVVLDLVDRIESLIAPLNPVLIYLRPEDVESHFRDVINVRGERLRELWLEAHDRCPYSSKARAAGYRGFLAFWREMGDLTDRAFDALSISKLKQVIPVDWGDLHGRTLEVLRLPASAPANPVPNLERFTGEYVPADDHTEAGFTLRTREGCLVAFVDDPIMDVQAGPIGCFREAVLIPRAMNLFGVAAWPHEVEFEVDGSGEAVRMCVSVSADGWTPVSRLFVKRNG